MVNRERLIYGNIVIRARNIYENEKNGFNKKNKKKPHTQRCYGFIDLILC